MPDRVILPALMGIDWRPLGAEAIPAIATLMAACLARDGGLPQVTDGAFIRGQLGGDTPEVSMGAHTSDGRLAAFVALRPAHTDEDYRIQVVGQVHPDYRGRGLGDALLRWSRAQALALLAAYPHDRPHRISVSNEAMTDAAARLYARHGLTEYFGEHVMRFDLRSEPPAAPLPAGVELLHWQAELAEQFFAAYDGSFRDRPGFPGWSAATWIEWASGDEGFRPELSLLARAAGQPVGFLINDANWVVQVGSVPIWRGRGLASALIATVLRQLRTEGYPDCLLTVNVNNPRARRVYSQLGFAVAGWRTRYLATL